MDASSRGDSPQDQRSTTINSGLVRNSLDEADNNSISNSTPPPPRIIPRHGGQPPIPNSFPLRQSNDGTTSATNDDPNNNTPIQILNFFTSEMEGIYQQPLLYEKM